MSSSAAAAWRGPGLSPNGGACSPMTSTRARAPPMRPIGGATNCASPMSARFAPPICPDSADLAWASFPCQDLSLAGAGAGLDGARSGAFWGFCAAIARFGCARDARRALIALENVAGVLTLQGRRGFRRDLHGAARPRLSLRRADDRRGAFSAAVAAAGFYCRGSPTPRFYPPALVVIRARRRITLRRRCSAPPRALPPSVAADWLWWRAPEPPRANLRLVDCLDEDRNETRWHGVEADRALARGAVAGLAPRRRARARERASARSAPCSAAPAPTALGGVRVQAEARFDGLAGCLRTPGGGSSRQFLIVVDWRQDPDAADDPARGGAADGAARRLCVAALERPTPFTLSATASPRRSCAS